MAFTFQEIVNMSATKTGREIAKIIGIVQPASSNNDEETYLKIEGNRVTRQAKEEVLAGNGHGLYGEKRRSRNNGGGKWDTDPLATINDVEIVMAARLAAKKAGISEDGKGIRDAIESGNQKVIAFLNFALSPDQIATLEKAVGVLSPEEREKKKREELVASIRMSVQKAARLDSMRKELETAGFTVDAPAWFARCATVDLDQLATHSVKEIERIALGINSVSWSEFLKSRPVMAIIR